MTDIELRADSINTLKYKQRVPYTLAKLAICYCIFNYIYVWLQNPGLSGQFFVIVSFTTGFLGQNWSVIIHLWEMATRFCKLWESLLISSYWYEVINVLFIIHAS